MTAVARMNWSRLTPSLMARMAEALRECSDELEQVVEAHYERTKDYPSELRRYQRDMEPVIGNRA